MAFAKQMSKGQFSDLQKSRKKDKVSPSKGFFFSTASQNGFIWIQTVSSITSLINSKLPQKATLHIIPSQNREVPKFANFLGCLEKHVVPSWTCWAQAVDVLMILVIAKPIFQICLLFFCWWPSNPIILERMYTLLGTHTSPPKEFPFPEARLCWFPQGIYPGQIGKNCYQVLVIPPPSLRPPSQITGCGRGTTILQLLFTQVS